jgi:hypothetical protein
MTDPILDLLDRQAAFLLSQEGRTEFLVQVELFLRALETEPRLAAYLEDVIGEAVDAYNELEAADEALRPELIHLRSEFARLIPALDDSGMEHPSGLSGDLIPYQGSLAFFDELAEGPAPRLSIDGSEGRAATLIRILQAKAELHRYQQEKSRAGEGSSNAVEVPGLDDWRRRVGNADRRYRAAARTAQLRSLTSAGQGLARLRLVPPALNPPFEERRSGEDPLVFANRVFRYAMSAERTLFKAVGGRLDDSEQRIVDDRVAELRRDVLRLSEELHRRVGTTRSRLALIERFKHRAEWHDRERLVAVANNKEFPGGPEDRLTAELARFLFDQGLSPLTKPLTAGLEPDLLDPSLRPGFYVEAKQYNSASNARRDVLNSVKQVFDTVGRLQGTPYEVQEAFCVIFRRSGPRYVVPDRVSGERYYLYLRLIDLGSASESGRRQRQQPITLAESDFIETGAAE